MIFDMTRRSSGGGSGPSASDAILTVTVPTGSTVTMTKGGVTLTPTMWVQAADPTFDCALFVISPSLFDSQNAWTVTATLGTDTTSVAVTIDSNEQYELALNFRISNLYQEVEYLAVNSAGPIINTGVANTNTAYFEITGRWKSAPGNNNAIFGVSGSYETCINSYTGRGQYFAVGGPFSGNDQYISISNPLQKHIYKADSVDMYIDGVAQNKTPGWNNATNIIYYLFAINLANTYIAASNIEINSARFWDNTELVREFIPCYRKSDSVPGMWERINKAFYTNAGSGTFVVGPDV